MDLPFIRVRGLPGKREDLYLAGIIKTQFIFYLLVIL
tara:strand:- start:1031 stop:1141 length:111 start_codon:yes stop_codon:yes gene_type:complete